MIERFVNRIDKSTLPFLLLGLFAIWETRHINIGNFANPGAGLFPLLIGVLLVISSLISLWRGHGERALQISEATNIRNVLFGIGILLIFRFGLPLFGYTLTTFLMFILLLKIVGDQKWLKTIVYSAMFTSVTYLVFVKFLAIRFPKGIFPI